MTLTTPANEIKLYTSASLTSGTYQLLNFLIKEVNKNSIEKIIIRSIPGAEGRNAYNRFIVEQNSMLFNQEDSFKTHNISLDNFIIYQLINNPHSVIVSTSSNINTIDDIIILSQNRRLFHGRLSSGATSELSLHFFIKKYNINNVYNISGYRNVQELTLALANNELDFVIRSYGSFNNSSLVKNLLELEVGSKWILLYKHNMNNVINDIDNVCKNSKVFHEFAKKMNSNHVLCLTP
jgi:tripartite-type tricarboxylate transporter receptor subunit TctC